MKSKDSRNIERVCPNCGKVFKGRSKYCCHECYVQDKGIGVKKYANCVVCGKQFELINGRGTMVCSNECLRKLRHDLFVKEKPVSICKNCGKEFKHENYDGKEFCSRECYWEYRRNHRNEFEYIGEKRKAGSHEVRVCEMCGKEFVTYKKSERRFCSDECRAKYCKTPERNEKRNKTIMERYGKEGLSALHQISEERRLQYIEYRKKRYANNIMSFLDGLGVNYVINNRQIIHPYEIDIFVPSHNLGIEINGNFWHSEGGGKDVKYHINKSKMANEVGVKLIHIYEDEIVNKFNIVKSRIRNALGLTERKIYARNCSLREISSEEKKCFLNANHIQGNSNSSYNYGLFYNDELVSVMTFNSERIIYRGTKHDGVYELIRFANKLNTVVVGAFSKMLKHFINDANPSEIKTYCDVRWSGLKHDGTVYELNGFEYEGTTPPNYWYVRRGDMLNRKHRYAFTKHAILHKHPELDSSLTEKQLMEQLNYLRIWDCGNMKFRLIV